MSLAIFDLDNTILAGDSDYLWGEFLVEQGLVDGDWYRSENQRFYDAYKKGTLDIFEFLAFSLAPLAAHSMDKLQALHTQFMKEKINDIILPKAEQQIQHHRRQGDYLMIITATNSFVTAPIAQKLGVDTLLATEAEINNGRYTGRVHGTPCFQQGKVQRLQQWLDISKQDLRESWFYSDSHNDIPLLERVSYPVAVDADDALLAHARNKGWQSISFR